MAKKRDIIVVGGGPAGAAAAWRAARLGANVMCLDKARFPRDKPCGDGLTPRAIKLVSSMGLGPELTKFHRVERLKLVTASTWEVGWPRRPGMAQYAYVARRIELDDMLLRCAADAGADVRQGTEVVAPILDHGRVVGVRAVRNGTEHDYRADVVVAADGAHSRLKRALTIEASSGVLAIAIRAEVPADRADSATLEAHLLTYGRRHLPGYGWVFPLGAGRLNIGVGYLTTYRRWRDVNARDLFSDFLSQLPADWHLPAVGPLTHSRALQAWRLPMGFTTRPAWRPGIIFAGDAGGVAKPASGAGISRALESGHIAAEVASEAIDADAPHDLSRYDSRLHRLWGNSYRIANAVMRFESSPRVLDASLTMLDRPFARRLMLRAAYGDVQSMKYR